MSLDKRFVYAGTTSTPVVNSKSEVEKMLVRYGATAFQITHDYAAGRAEVSFRVPDSARRDAEQVPVRIPLNVNAVYRSLFGTEWVNDARRAKQREQAERVAWRNLVLWLNAALSTATIGLQTITESFFAHAVIGPNGETGMQWATAMMDPARQLSAGDDA